MFCCIEISFVVKTVCGLVVSFLSIVVEVNLLIVVVCVVFFTILKRDESFIVLRRKKKLSSFPWKAILKANWHFTSNLGSNHVFTQVWGFMDRGRATSVS